MNSSEWQNMETAHCKSSLCCFCCFFYKHDAFAVTSYSHMLFKILRKKQQDVIFFSTYDAQTQDVKECEWLNGDLFRFHCFTVNYSFLFCLVSCQTWRRSDLNWRQKVMMVQVKLPNQSHLFTLCYCCSIDLHLRWSDDRSCVESASVISAIHTPSTDTYMACTRRHTRAQTLRCRK